MNAAEDARHIQRAIGVRRMEYSCYLGWAGSHVIAAAQCPTAGSIGWAMERCNLLCANDLARNMRALRTPGGLVSPGASVGGGRAGVRMNMRSKKCVYL